MSEKRYEIFDGKMIIDVPEGFHVLSDKEITAMGGKPVKNAWAIRDEEKHLAFEIAWKNIPLLAKKATLETVIKNTEKQISQRCEEYRTECDTERVISGEKALGFEYSYAAGDIYMISEYILVKLKNHYIAFSCLGRRNTYDEYYPIFDKMLNSIVIK